MEIVAVLFVLIVAVLSIAVVVLYAMVLQERKRADTAMQEALVRAAQHLKHVEKRLRAAAIKKSKEVITGKVAEQMIPFRDDFGYNPRDCRFLGSPIDFLVFDGLTEGALKQIVFIEVKTGKYATLSKRERQVRNVIDEGEVYYRVLHVGGKSEGRTV